MKSSVLRRRMGRLVLALAAGVAVAGCDLATDPFLPEPVGVVVVDEGGVEVARFSAVTGAVSGTLAVGVNDTERFRVHLVDRVGRSIPITGERFTVRATVLNVTLATVERVAEDEIRITGRQPGNPSLQLTILEGGLDIFTTPVFIPISVRSG